MPDWKSKSSSGFSEPDKAARQMGVAKEPKPEANLKNLSTLRKLKRQV